MDKTFIKDLLVRGVIGVNDWERKRAQDILINVTVFSDTTKAGKQTISTIASITANLQKRYRLTLRRLHG